MSTNLPAAAFGHFVMKVSDVGTSYEFYTKFGLRPIGIFSDVAIIELRGGTHILLFNKNDELPFSLSPSPVSYTHLDVYKRQTHGCPRRFRKLYARSDF